MSEETTAELERQAEQARSQMASTAESLRNKMTAGQLFDEFSGMLAGGDSSQALANLKNQVRDNPLPLALIGAGLAWLALGKGPSTEQLASRVSHRHDSPPESGLDNYALHESSITDARSREQSSARSFVSDATSSLHSVASSAGSAATTAADSVRSFATQTGRTASEAIGAVGSGVKSAGQSIGKGSSGAATGTKQALNKLADEPILLAALGVAAGATLGLLLPQTQFEQEHLEPVGSKLRDQASNLVEEGLSQAKEVAAEAYATIKEEGANLSLGGDEPLAKQVSGIAQKVASDAASNVQDRLGFRQEENQGNDGQNS